MSERPQAAHGGLIYPQWPGQWPVPAHLGVVATTVVHPAADSLESAHASQRGSVYGGFNLGPHVGDDPQRVGAHRAQLQQILGLRAMQWMDQVHGTAVFEASVDTALRSLERPPRADALWTSGAGLGLAVMTADCLPIVLYAPDPARLAVVHGGWRGLADGVVEAAIAALAGAPTDRWLAWIGPGISGVRYEVGEEVADALRAPMPASVSDAALGLQRGERPGKYQLDLIQQACWRLRQAGIQRVCASGLCTYSDARFYSHRQASAQGHAATGRMATVAWLRS